MLHRLKRRTCAFCLVLVAGVAAAQPAGGQTMAAPPPPAVAGTHASTPSEPVSTPPLWKPFTQIFGDLKRVPGDRHNLGWLVVGMGTAAAANRADAYATETWPVGNREPFKPGAIVGGTPLELGAAFMTYAVGRATHSPRAMSVGGDLIRGQILAEVMTVGLKQAVRRSRPEGSGFSFPSGHTGVTFASATVLQRHFGWKAGVPAYAVAGYVAASRVQMRRHYLSDVAFGAALGIIAGRTVTIGHNKQLALTPIAASNGAGVGFTWVGRAR
jgi:membrane-associated phospholipid phosphatase